MSELWYPDAVRRPEPDNGSYTGGPPKGLIHSTEVPFGGGWATYTGSSKPHIEAIGITATQTVAYRQFYPRDMPARSLQDRDGGVRTNRDSVFQFELGFQAAKVSQVPGWFWDGLAPALRWAENNHGIDPDVWADFKAYPGSFGFDNGVRFGQTKWDGYNGWCGHQHCPENDHGDPGLIPVARLKRGDWFDMATKADLREVLDAVVTVDNPSFMNALKAAIESERAEDAQAVWDVSYTHPNGTSAPMKVWLAYANSKVDGVRTVVDAIKAKLGA